jgi:hypothetical protein
LRKGVAIDSSKAIAFCNTRARVNRALALRLHKRFVCARLDRPNYKALPRRRHHRFSDFRQGVDLENPLDLVSRRLSSRKFPPVTRILRSAPTCSRARGGKGGNLPIGDISLFSYIDI